MKKLLLIALAPLLIFAESAFATLPPLWQGVKEMEAILKSEQLKEHFTSGDQIQEIIKGENNTYYVRGNNAACIVEVTYLPTERPGPAQFTLNFKGTADQFIP